MKRSHFLAGTAAGLGCSTPFANALGANVKPNYVLVHGAFSDETAWQYVVPVLERAGARVSTVTLPGHSDADTAMAGRFTLADYVAAITAKLDAAGAPVILVGHSMGGVAITQTAELHPGKIAALIYLSAYLPETGKALLDYSQDSQSKLGPNIVIDKDRGIGTITVETMQAAFFNTTPSALAIAAEKRLRPEPLQPFVTPVATTPANFGKLPRYYITTLRDQAVGPALQKAMYTAQSVHHVYPLDADHSSYFSKPDQLAAALLDVREQVG
jgi:pimeloyl-ACP methyl ester carboxylesterase